MSCYYSRIERRVVSLSSWFCIICLQSIGKAPTFVKYLFVVTFFQIRNDRIGVNKIVSLWKGLGVFKMKTGPNILGKGAILIFCKKIKLLEFSEYLCTAKLLCGYFWGNEINTSNLWWQTFNQSCAILESFKIWSALNSAAF